MSSGSSLPYRLRPNKAVDRELFLSLLARLAATLGIESYRYVGLGGPFLEDFRLMHAKLGIDDMVCIESEENVHKRQKFNRPVECIECIHDTLENYLESTDHEKPVIIWLDFTTPKTITDQIETFSRTVFDVPINSIIRITVNANPASLGNPDPENISIQIGAMNSKKGIKKTLSKWRLDRFREQMGDLFPSDINSDWMTRKNYGRSLLRTLFLAVEKERLSHADRKVIWSLATHYADGQPMATATVIVCPVKDSTVEGVVREWQFNSLPDSPLLLDMPSLSTLERLTMESSENAKIKLGFDLPESNMGGDPFESFRKFYRVFPHFSRVEL